MNAYRISSYDPAIMLRRAFPDILSVSILDQAITPRRPVQRNDDSTVSLLSLPMLNSARRDSSLESTLPPFLPALRIDGQSLPQGRCITSASEGQELHLHTNQVIKDLYQSLSPILDLTIISGERIAQPARCRMSRRRCRPTARRRPPSGAQCNESRDTPQPRSL
jgi:hypothetical protein